MGTAGSTDEKYSFDAVGEKTEILWKCSRCGELEPRKHWAPAPCPSCGAPKTEFVLVDED